MCDPGEPQSRILSECASLEVKRRAARCGSYPYRYIAEDFGLPYDVVLNYSDAVREGADANKEPPHRWGRILRMSFWAGEAVDYVAAKLRGIDRQRFHAAVYRQVIGAGHG